MKSDVDRLMRENNLDALIVLGDESPNSYRDYLTNRSKANGSLFKRHGEEPIFVVGSMEVGEAATSGLKVYTPYDFGLAEALERVGNWEQAMRDVLCNILRKLEISGRVGLFGVADVAGVISQIGAIHECIPDIVIAGNVNRLFENAYETKDDAEIEQLKQAGKLTSQLVRDTWEFISQHRAEGDQVVDVHGVPLTVGAVKRFIRLRQTELGLDDPSGCIFAQGYEGALPHSEGKDEDVVRVGVPIVFDIFPRLQKSGYYHDMTRTWCINSAPAEVQAAYDDVMIAFRASVNALKVGAPGRNYQNMVCDYFESKGHPTQRSIPGTMSGYVHGLGHGLGLNIHEAPGLGLFTQETLQPRNVFTVEPGLYYPERGFGVRVEDTVYFDGAGVLHTLTDFPYDLILPLKG